MTFNHFARACCIRGSYWKLSFKFFDFRCRISQLIPISSFVLGHDTFVSLPTGYGKSVIYAALPYIFDILRGELNVCLAFKKNCFTIRFPRVMIVYAMGISFKKQSKG